MSRGPTTLRPPFAHFVGLISTVTFPLWVLVVVVDLLGLRPSKAPLNYLWLGGVFWLMSILFASPSLFFRLRFAEDRLEFRWFGYPTLVVQYGAIVRFDLPVYSWGGLRLHLETGTRDVYWVDLQKTADLLRERGVPQSTGKP